MDGKVAIVVTVYRNPAKLSWLMDNIHWAGRPDIPLYVFEDPSPYPDRGEITHAYRRVCAAKNAPLMTAPEWGCMQGVIDFALRNTIEDWIIYVPDDVLFTRGGLWNEYAGVLAYGRDFVGAIQAPYWNAHELVDMGLMLSKAAMYNNWRPESVPRNPHWEYPGVPRKYINVNGAGFSISRKLFNAMNGWPTYTWRLDEWAGYQAWQHGMVCITLPGPPRTHYHGGSTPEMPQGLEFHSVESWKAASGRTPDECGRVTNAIMEKIPDGTWDGIIDFFSKGGKLV